MAFTGFYRGPGGAEFEAHREKGLRQLAATEGAAWAGGGLVRNAKSIRDQSNLLDYQQTQADALDAPDKAPSSPQFSSAEQQSLSAEEKGFNFSPVVPDAVDTGQQQASAAQQIRGKLTLLGRYAQKFFAPTGITDNPDIRDKSLQLANTIGQHERSAIAAKHADTVRGEALKTTDPAAYMATIDPERYGRMRPGSLPGPPTKSGSTTNLYSIALAAAKGDPAEALRLIQSGKIAAAVAGRPTYGPLPVDPGNQVWDQLTQMLGHPPTSPPERALWEKWRLRLTQSPKSDPLAMLREAMNLGGGGGADPLSTDNPVPAPEANPAPGGTVDKTRTVQTKDGRTVTVPFYR